MRASAIQSIDGDAIVSGDGQCDSPGHSAKYLTYFLMVCNQPINYVIHIECMDKREVNLKSSNMEVVALKRSIQKLQKDVNISEVVTDASTSAIKMIGM